MVYYHGKKARGAKPKQAKQPGAKLTDLPDELLIQMLHDTDITVVLRLRATSKRFVHSCTEIIRDKLKILYVHPSPSSVLRAINICKSDLSSNVDEVCFVSKAPNRITGALARGFDLPWPTHTPRDEKGKPRKNPSNEPWAAFFSQSYEELLSSLAGLKRLQAFSFQESCDRPGLNMLSAQRLSNWLKTIGQNMLPSKERRAENALYVVQVSFTPSNNFVFADIDALDAVLNHHKIHVTRLKLGHELLKPSSNPTCAMGIVRPQTLTRLDLLATTYWKRCEWHKFCRDLLRSAAPSLKELRLGIRNCIFSAEHDSGQSWHTLAHLLRDTNFPGAKYLDFPKVERLELYSAPSRIPPSNLDLYMIQWFNLETFLNDYCRELRVLRLSDIIPIRDSIKLGLLSPKDHTMMENMHLHLGLQVREITGPGLPEVNAREWEIVSED